MAEIFWQLAITDRKCWVWRCLSAAYFFWSLHVAITQPTRDLKKKFQLIGGETSEILAVGEN